MQLFWVDIIIGAFLGFILGDTVGYWRGCMYATKISMKVMDELQAHWMKTRGR